jgi:hypothetical protein
MNAEIEAAAADSVTGLFRPKTKPFTKQDQPCANCGTPLEGWYCHACGQNADTHHRSILHLIWEAIEGLFHLDGRLWRTLPLLFFKPGVLAKDYMEGRIARHVPPFRTFLVALLLFIFAAEHAIHQIKHHEELKDHERAALLATPQGRAAEAAKMRAAAAEGRRERLADAASERDEGLKDTDQDKAKVAERYAEDVQKAQTKYDAAMAKALALQNNTKAAQEELALREATRQQAAEKVRNLSLTGKPDEIEAQAVELGQIGDTTVKVAPSPAPHHGPPDAKRGAWLKEGIAKAIENPEYYLVVMFGWAHRLAVLLLPIVGLSLAFVYLNKRQYFIYDHLLVATNLLSFAFLTNAIGMVLPEALAVVWFVVLAIWTPINLFQTLRGAYGSSIVGAILKTLFVWWSTVVAFSLLLVGLLILSLAQI